MNPRQKGDYQPVEVETTQTSVYFESISQQQFLKPSFWKIPLDWTEFAGKPLGNSHNTLLPNEVLTGDFDCYFLEKIVPLWKNILLVVLTGGISIVGLIFQ